MVDIADTGDAQIFGTDGEAAANHTNNNNRSITCFNIPDAFVFDRTAAKRHFGRFGNIHAVNVRSRQNICTVEFESATAAADALASDAYSYNGHVFEIGYTESPNDQRDALDPDVQRELRAMLGETVPAPVSVLQRLSTAAASPVHMRNGSPTIKQRLSAVVAPPADRTASARNGRNGSPAGPGRKREIDAAVRLELETLMRRPGQTSEDRYRILDARDKLVRLTTATTTDLARAVSTLGLCPDLCPEKERYMREATHHMAVFELLPNGRTIDHKQALKQYSRSSADQESPLAHELRPEPVLQLTMQLLLNRVVDLCELPDTNLADWFHFVWDRTRGIRKDISQQELCSLGAVQLVEQCARVHIHCAGRLVAEEPQVFDSKINSENLTKCLQSLKYLYHDLQLRTVRCPNEAEFRAYVILLNLNDGQFFWELKQLPDAILHAPEVRFALKVYMTIETSNYVRFFRLVRETTYMNACILLRYFMQMRLIALQTMLKAYAPRQAVPMALSYWQYVLAFEDAEQTAQFFEYYGLRCDRDGDRVQVDRTALYRPDTPFWLDRAINVVEHKRACSVGQAIWGADSPLPPFDEAFAQYTPHNSFDDRGYLRTRSWMAEDQNYWHPQPNDSDSPATVHANGIDSDAQDDDYVDAEFAEPEEVDADFEDDVYGNGEQPFDDDALDEEGEDDLDDQSVDSNDGMYSAVPVSKPPDAPGVFKMPALPAARTSNAPGGSSIFGGSAPVSAAPVSGASLFAHHNGSSFGSVPFANAALDFQSGGSIFGSGSAISSSFNDRSSTSNGLPMAAQASSGAVPYGLFSSVFGFSTSVPATNSANQPAASGIFGGNASSVTATAVSTFQPPVPAFFVPVAPAPKTPTPPPPVRRRESLDREKMLALEREQLRRQRLVDKYANGILDTLCTELVHTECRSMCEQAVEQQRQISAQAETFTERFLAEQLAEFMHETFDVIVTQYRQATRSQRIAEKYWDRWRRNTMRRRRHREHLAVTPLWITADVDRAMHVPLELAMPQQQEALQHRRAHRQLAQRSTVTDRLRGADRKSREPQDPIDVFAIVADSLPAGQPRSTFWKCIVSLPLDSERLQKWLRGAFQQTAASADVLFCGQKKTPFGSSAVCMRVVLGPGLIDPYTHQPASDQQLSGASSILMFVSALETQSETVARLANMQRLPLPMDVVLHRTRSDRSDLQTFVQNLSINGRIHANESRTLRDNTLNAIRHLCGIRSERVNRTEHLRMQRITSFFEQTLGSQLWVQLAQSVRTNPGLLAAMHRPEAAVNVYNAALDRLRTIIVSDTDAYAVFPEEFRRLFASSNTGDLPLTWEHFPADWKCPRRVQQLHAFLDSLALNAPGNLHDETRLRAYVEAHFPVDARTVIAESLWRVERSIEQQPTNAIVWLDPIRELCLSRLNYEYAQCCAANRLPPDICYVNELLQQFCLRPWWLDENVIGRMLHGAWEEQQQHMSELELSAVDQTHNERSEYIDSSMLDDLLERSRALIDRVDESMRTGREAAAKMTKAPKRPGLSVSQDTAHVQHKKLKSSDAPTLAHVASVAEESPSTAGIVANDDCNDLASILARGQARLERADRLIRHLYTSSATSSAASTT